MHSPGVRFPPPFLYVALLLLGILLEKLLPLPPQYLEGKFGDEYRQYMSQIRRWI